jgi:hypothetical protein
MMMKTIFISLLAIIAISVYGCKKTDRTVTVIKDCTGTYLRYEGKDYHVCNYEIAEGFTSGTEVTATYIKIKECNDPSICLMAHQNEGWIDVVEIK